MQLGMSGKYNYKYENVPGYVTFTSYSTMEKSNGKRTDKRVTEVVHVKIEITSLIRPDGTEEVVKSRKVSKADVDIPLSELFANLDKMNGHQQNRRAGRDTRPKSTNKGLRKKGRKSIN